MAKGERTGGGTTGNVGGGGRSPSVTTPVTPKASQLLALTPEQEEFAKRLRAAGLLLDSQSALL